MECNFKEITYTFMGRLDRHDLEQLGSCLELALLEASEVSFTFTGRNRHSFNRIFLVLHERGGNNFIRNHTPGSDQRLKMTRRMIYFMPGNTDLEFSFKADMRFISFHFHLNLFSHFDVFSGQRTCAAVPDEKGFCGELSDILNFSGYDLQNLCRLQSMLIALAGDFIEPSNAGLDRLDFLNSKYSAVFEYVRNSADATTGIDDLAEVAKMSRDSLSREFSRDCGIPLKKYLNRNLIRKAEKQLLEPKATARMVAERLKFNNEYYFSRFFKKNTGTTTRDYREQMQTHRMMD